MSTQKNKAVAIRKSGREVASAADQEKLDLMKQAFPVEERVQFLSFPRLKMISQPITEEVKKNGKTELKVVTEAGTFCTEIQDEEESEVEEEVIVKGKKKVEIVKKKLWQTTEIGTTIQGIIIFQRKQLKFFDEAGGNFISSAMYDKDTDIVPLFEGKTEIARGTPKELQEPYMALKKGQNGKPDKNVSDLKDTRILYVYLPEFEKVFQLSIGGTSMYSYLNYTRTVMPSVPGVLTEFTSEGQENGKIRWNKMMFEKVRDVTDEEADQILEAQGIIMKGIMDAKAFFASKEANAEEDEATRKAREDFDNM